MTELTEASALQRGTQIFLDHPQCRVMWCAYGDKYVKTSSEGREQHRIKDWRHAESLLSQTCGNRPKYGLSLDSAADDLIVPCAFDPDSPNGLAIIQKRITDEMLTTESGSGFMHKHFCLTRDYLERFPPEWWLHDRSRIKAEITLDEDNAITLLSGPQQRILPPSVSNAVKANAMPGANGHYKYLIVSQLPVNPPSAIAYLDERIAAFLNAKTTHSLPNKGNGKIKGGEGQHRAMRDHGLKLAHNPNLNPQQVIQQTRQFVNDNFDGGVNAYEQRYPGDIMRTTAGGIQLAQAASNADPGPLFKINDECALENGTGRIVNLRSGQVIPDRNFHILYADLPWAGLEESASLAWLKWDGKHRISPTRVMKPSQPRIAQLHELNPDTGMVENVNALNLWQGFGVRPVNHGPEVTHAIDMLMRHLLSRSETRVAALFQQHQFGPILFPGAKLRYAIYMYGPEEGVGKTMWCQLVREVYGPIHGLPWSDSDLMSKYNGALERALYVHVEEPSSIHAPKLENTLKSYITDLEITVEDKYQDKKKIANLANFTFTANEAAGVKINPNSRRWLGVQMPDTTLSDDFYQQLGDWIDAKIAQEQLLFNLLNNHEDYFPLSHERIQDELPMRQQEAQTSDPQHRAWQEQQRLLGRTDRPLPKQQGEWDAQRGKTPLLWNWNTGKRPAKGAANSLMAALSGDDAVNWIREVMASPYQALNDLYPAEYAYRADGWIFYVKELRLLMGRADPSLKRVSSRRLTAILHGENLFHIPMGGHAKTFAWCLIPPVPDMLDNEEYNAATINLLMETRRWISLLKGGHGVGPEFNAVNASDMHPNILDAMQQAKLQNSYQYGPSQADLKRIVGRQPNLNWSK